MRNTVLLLLTTLLFSCITQEKVERVELIAHAGGAIDGNIYTNSLEALQQAKANGYEFIELDLIFTSDSVLVAAHSWGDFNEITGFAHKGDSAPSFAEFSSRRIYNCYTPLSAEEINTFFTANKELYLVTDKTSSPEVLAKCFPGLKDRMVVEAFNYSDYCKLIDEGYFRVLYSCMASDLKPTLLKSLLFHRLFPGKKILWLALHTSGLEYDFFKLLNNWRKFNIALFTVDDYSEIPEKYKKRFGMIYTNTITPEK